MSRSFPAAAAAAILSCALVLVAAGPAGASTARAAQAAPLTQVVPMTGKAKNGKRFNGTLAIHRFVSRSGKLWAVGRLSGTLKRRHVSRAVRIPAVLANNGATAAQIPPTPNACQILSLTLQPIDLNLLGLRIRTSRIDLLIEGVRGPGNLLGNLLCGLTGILDPNTLAASPLSTLARFLNAALALSPRTA